MDSESEVLWSRAVYSDVLAGGTRVRVIRQHVPEDDDDLRVPPHLRIAYESGDDASAAVREAVAIYVDDDDETVDILWEDGAGTLLCSALLTHCS